MEVVAEAQPPSISTATMLLGMDTESFKNEVNCMDNVREINVLLGKVEDGTRRHALEKRKLILIRNAGAVEDLEEFKARVADEKRYSALTSLGKIMQTAKDKKRLRIVSRRIEELQKSGELKKKVRVEGTGTRVEKTFVYARTKANDDLGRSGKEYKKWVWEGAEYEYQDRRIRKRRIQDENTQDENKPKRPKNKWLQALDQAKQELGVSGLVIVRREALDREDEKQILGERVYKRARAILDKAKAENQ